MSGFYNPSAPETLGMEWFIDTDLGTVVLDSATKGFGHRFPGVASKVSQSIAAYAAALSGTGTFGCEVYSAPYNVAVPQSYESRYPGTDTGSDFTSPTNGNAAWLTQTGAAATYVNVGPGSADVTYLRNVNQVEGPVPARMMMRGNANVSTAAFAGKRVLSVEMHTVVKSTLLTAPIAAGNLNLSGIDYTAKNFAVPVGLGYVDVACGYWELNPSTLLPWTADQINNLIAVGATDEFGVFWTWNANYTSSFADTMRVIGVYLLIRWQPEDRLGYATGLVTTTGWQPWSAKSVANLLSKQDSNLALDTATTGSWVADANTTLTNDVSNPGAPWTRSLKMLAVGVGNFGAKSGFYPCIAGKTMAFRNISNATSGRTTTLSIEFYDPSGNLLQTANSAGDAMTGAYKAIGMTAAVIVPLGATQYKAHIVTNGSAGGQTCFSTQNTVGLDQTAINLVRDTYPGALAKMRFDGSAEVAYMARGLNEIVAARRINGTGLMSMPSLPPGVLAAGMPLGQESNPITLQDGAGAVLSLGADQGQVTALVSTSLHNYDTANGPQAAYSQSYAARVKALVNSGNTVQDEKTLPAKTYTSMRLVVSGEIDPPSAALVLKLKRRSDNVQAGGNATINPTDLVPTISANSGGIATRTTAQVFIVPIATPAANTAVQYYVEASSSAPPGSGWVIYALDDVGYAGDSVSADTIVFGAGVDGWTDPFSGGENTHRDGMIVVQTAPAAPTGVTATVVGNHINVAWTATVVGGTFEATEVWRSDDRAGIDSAGYVQIADITPEATVLFSDAESRRGVDATYKIRTRRIDQSVSDFSTATSPVQTPTTGFDLWFVSNEAPFAMYIYGHGIEQPRWAPPVERVLAEYSGRDGAVAFLPIEDPLDAWSRTMALYWYGNQSDCSPLVAPTITGRAAFNALEALCRASLSYVCVLDPLGNRWYSNVAVTEMRYSEGHDEAGGYVAAIEVRELQDVPSTPTKSPA